MGLCISKIEYVHYLDDERCISKHITLALSYLEISKIVDPCGIFIGSTRQCLLYNDVVFGLQCVLYNKEKDCLSFLFENSMLLQFFRADDKITYMLFDKKNNLCVRDCISETVIENYLPFNIKNESYEFDIFSLFINKREIKLEYKYEKI